MEMESNINQIYPHSPYRSSSSSQNHYLNINAKSYMSPKLYNKIKSQNSPLNSQFQQSNRIVEVYSDNFIKEIKRIGEYLKFYPFIGMDTEFPGIVYPCPSYTQDFYYKFTKANIDKLKLIQIGITLTNDKGEYPPLISTWQFNLKFDVEKEKHSVDSISLLMECGIDFEVLKKKGISYNLFAEYFLVSGLVLNDNVTWISFNGISDFCYMLRLVLNEDLPNDELDFLQTLKIYFPNLYDIKYLIKDNENFKGGLNKLAKELNVERTGEMHQAGSDSIVTIDVFFKLIKNNDINKTDLLNGKNVIFGVGKGTDIKETIAYTQFDQGVEVGYYIQDINRKRSNEPFYNNNFYNPFQ